LTFHNPSNIFNIRTQTITRKSDKAEKPSATTKEAVSFFRALKFKRLTMPLWRWLTYSLIN